ncbi:MAG: NADH:flavin oxidoreductase [Desulfotignum balticum]|jgi:2,4-dienoyl-CoA reductase-like NADH-dependent reductase (Old Yellow Enzyme family)|uniref:NADH:flavin oxidoreductase n=1 Tax=Desulfotignum balticum TaxID=115781 RepID=A0A931CYL7_9BACT|nr:NADH:flavin oxidoreductase [Desulfotignum balticum]
MTDLFDTTQINGMTLANRFVRSATWEGMAADDGSVTPRLTETVTELAKGGVGLIISGHSYVLPEGQAGPKQMGIYKDELIPGLASLTDAVHQAGGKIVAQLAHAGTFAAETLTRTPPRAVSVFDGLAKTPRHELTHEDIQHLVTAYVQAAERAKAAGFDGVQVHAAHGYLFSQFLSPAYNRRQDAYGGPIENRSRALCDTVAAICKALGPDFPVLVKINAWDDVENGLILEDSVRTAELLAAAGIDAVEVSGGFLTSKTRSPSRLGINSPEKEACFQAGAAAFKQALDIPVILVGGIRSLEKARELVSEGGTDYISLCRPLIREPGLINRWRNGDTRPALCNSDNLCFRPAFKGEGIYCVTEEREQTK